MHAWQKRIALCFIPLCVLDLTACSHSRELAPVVSISPSDAEIPRKPVVAKIKHLKQDQFLAKQKPKAEPIRVARQKPAIRIDSPQKIQKPIKEEKAERPATKPTVTESTNIAKTEIKKPKQESITVAVVQPAKAPISQPTQNIAKQNSKSWLWPVTGKIITRFKENNDMNKGIDIANIKGTPIVSVLPGKVVYSGQGLRGYGQLLIIKHDGQYLSAYAHNDELLVKEGQHVEQGQVIAKMGRSDSDQVKLHFEIRHKGKPVDPLGYLPGDR